MEKTIDVHFEHWDEDEFVIIIPGIGPCGRTLHKQDAEIIKRWLNTGVISEIKKPYIELAKKWRGPDSEKYARNLGIDTPLLNLCASELEAINKAILDFPYQGVGDHPFGFRGFKSDFMALSKASPLSSAHTALAVSMKPLD